METSRKSLNSFTSNILKANDPDKGGRTIYSRNFFANEFLQEQHDLLEVEAGDAEATVTDAKDGMKA